MNNYRFSILKVSFSFLIFVVMSFTQTDSLNNRSDDERLAVKAADTLINRFHETLDIGVVFDEIASPRGKEALERGKFSLGKVDRKFLQQQETQVKKRLFKDEMNHYYIKMAFFMTFTCNMGDKEKEDFCVSKEFNKEYLNTVSKFRFVKGIVDDGSPHGTPQIKTDADLSEYLTEIENVTSLLKKHLPHKYFNSKIYKSNYVAFVNNQDNYLKPKVECLKGESSFGVQENEKVFVVIRDIFATYFIKENGKMKLLGFVIGN